jgi:hypothetical protein
MNSHAQSISNYKQPPVSVRKLRIASASRILSFWSWPVVCYGLAHTAPVVSGFLSNWKNRGALEITYVIFEQFLARLGK